MRLISRALAGTLPLVVLPLMTACSSSAHSSGSYAYSSTMGGPTPLVENSEKILNAASIPFNETMIYPDNWPEIVRRRQEDSAPSFDQY